MKSIKKYIKESNSHLILLSILFLFFLQLISDLVEAIYMLDLLNTSLDEKVLGVLFLLTPLILIPFKKGISSKILYIIAEIVVILRVINPFMNTANKIIVAGLGVGCFLIFFPAYLSKVIKYNDDQKSTNIGVALGFAVILSITFRALLSSIDISTYAWFQIIGWFLSGVSSILIFGQFNRKVVINDSHSEEEGLMNSKRIFPLIIGLISIIALIYFAFSSPTVISRWTEGDYVSITILTSGMVALSILVITIKPDLLNKLHKRVFLTWNALFILSLLFTIFVNVIPFPTSPSSDPVIVTTPNPLNFIPLYLTLILLPVIFFDFIYVTKELITRKPSLPKIARNFTLGMVIFMLLIFIMIFTNVWGYVDVVSLIFRNLFWLPFLILGIFLFGAVFIVKPVNFHLSITKITKEKFLPKLTVTAIIFFFTIFGVLINVAFPIQSSGSVSSLKVFTYNIQQGVNVTGDKNYDNQIALIKEVNPDIIGLQECDTARISLGNTDVVRYFADRLTGFNYYSYYGPRTVTGTFGVAVLSKYPIISALSFFTYSDADEIGTAEVQIRVGTEIFNIYINHPDGSHEAKLTHITTLMSRIGSKNRVISMGDFNFRQFTEYYNLTSPPLQDAWLTMFPTAVGYGLDMTARIDHIFLSSDITILDARYIVDPQSDHPAHWVEIQW
ncbi:MAG: hypothetical protein EU533_00750 [Promethearchaeota archaeon]|nr:MAG: hypothetical protein EU533_00750 [Candidatus Lokiarchaeota archaeon]